MPYIGICPQVLSHGTCTTEGCQFKHDVHLCQPCGVVCTSQSILQSHLNGKKHKTRARHNACSHPSSCRLCNVQLGSPWNYPQHIQGRAHRALVDEQEERDESDPDAETESESLVPPGFVSCHICDTVVRSATLSTHVTGIKHRKRERFAMIQAAFDDADKDKHGVTISHGGENGIDFGFLEVDSLPRQPTNLKALDVAIKLTNPARIDITEVRFSSALAHRRRPSDFSLDDNTYPRRLWPGKPFTLTICFDPRLQVGRFSDRLEVVFLDTVLCTQFVITRSLHAIIGSEADWNIIKPTAPYKPKRRGKQQREIEVIPGVKPRAIADIIWVVDLPMAMIPKALEAVLADPSNKSVVVNLKRTWLPRVLDADTHARHFKLLLHVEEATMNIDIQRYDDEDVPLDPVLPFYRLPVPGLAEKRPSVIVGDRILVQNKGSTKSGHWFEGHVHRVRQSDVDLKFHGSFNSYKGQRYNIRFKLGRLPLRRMHQALGTAFKADRVLFPSAMHVTGIAPTQSQMNGIRAVNKLIPTNPPQLLAVTRILHMPKGSVPFVLFGPPGTGKTVTVVEAMRQIILADPNARILACAPSNSAADLIADRLRDNLSSKELFRLNAPSRNKDQLPKSLERFAQSNSDGTFSVPPLEILSQFRIIVSTCISASVPYGIGMRRGHFSHIFLDEAGQALEQEAMIPIKTMADNDTNIVLSGDPKQLGPIIRSSVAKELGMGVSYLERLMAREVYDVVKGHGISVVKLIKNWRSHPVILKYPNEKFYGGDLEPHGNEAITHSLLRSHVVVKPGFPIVFHGITGKDMREANSPSFFNTDEASQAKRYVDALRTDQRLRLKDEHIGVITPYHAQALKIRQLLRQMYSGVKVGSVEEFQGQERRVIIVSTVRSSVEFVDYDVKYTLGFVANPRRFNVAITRAQALLIVIGDPTVLSLDPLWRGFMNYIFQGGGWKGKDPDWDTHESIRPEGGYDVERRQTVESEMDQLVDRMRETIIENSERLGADDAEEAHVDRPWREAE